MKKTCVSSRKRPILPIFLLMLCTMLLPVNVEAGNARTSTFLTAGMMTPDISPTICAGEKINLEYYFEVISSYASYRGRAAPLVPNVATVNLSAKMGKISPAKFNYPKIVFNSVYTGQFTYTAGKKAGSETININISAAGYTTTIQVPFEVIKCKASIQFSTQKTFSYDIVTMISTYSGSGHIGTDDEGKISGSGSYIVRSKILPYGKEGGSCVLSTPWEGTAIMTFSGEVGENGVASIAMNLDELTVNSASLTCHDEEYTNSLTFPSYTYSACQVQLTGFSFTKANLQVPFNCPGQEPFTMSITITPRRER